MPKKNGIIKTYSFSVDVVKKLMELCEKDKRSQTNYIEKLICDQFERERKEECNGKS